MAAADQSLTARKHPRIPAVRLPRAQQETVSGLQTATLHKDRTQRVDLPMQV